MQRTHIEDEAAAHEETRRETTRADAAEWRAHELTRELRELRGEHQRALERVGLLERDLRAVYGTALELERRLDTCHAACNTLRGRVALLEQQQQPALVADISQPNYFLDAQSQPSP